MKKTMNINNFFVLLFLAISVVFASESAVDLQPISCKPLRKPDNGYFINGYCSNSIHSACGLGCGIGYRLRGSSFRHCRLDNQTNSSADWTGTDTVCDIVACRPIELGDASLRMNCTNNNETRFGTECVFACPDGYLNLGSSSRRCLPIGIWSGTKPKCKKLNVNKEKSSVATLALTSSPKITTTSFFESHFEDLSNWTISFGYSFKRVLVQFAISLMPATSSIWLRTNYTNNTRVLVYTSTCFNASILTNENSTLVLRISRFVNENESRDYLFELGRALHRNKWLQVTFGQTDESHFRVFLDGAGHFDSNDFSVFKTQAAYCQTSNERNEFKIVDDDLDENSSLYATMRGEITRASIFDSDRSDEDIVNAHFTCTDEDVDLKASFLWSDVFVDHTWSQFKRRPSSFCRGCKEPNLIQHALMYYDGTKNGDVLSYSCQNGYRLIGHATSVCMVTGSWSHRTPRCRAYQSFDARPTEPATTTTSDSQSLIIHILKS